MYHFELKPFRRPFAGDWEREVERIFDGVYKADGGATPACEIRDEEGAFRIELDVPGVGREDLDIEVKENHLYVTGERKASPRGEKVHVLRAERRFGKFTRVFTIPQNVHTAAIEARVDAGVLTLVLPKEEKVQPKKISISDRKNPEVLADLKS
jgi:HSP20 family protein